MKRHRFRNYSEGKALSPTGKMPTESDHPIPGPEVIKLEYSLRVTDGQN